MVLLLAVSVGASAKTTSYICKFPKYGSPLGIKPDPNFELRFVHDKGMGKAYMLGNNGSSEVDVLPNGSGISFLEISAVGNIFTTTISLAGDAVHSRHTMILKELVPSQYYGTCAIQ